MDSYLVLLSLLIVGIALWRISGMWLGSMERKRGESANVRLANHRDDRPQRSDQFSGAAVSFDAAVREINQATRSGTGRVYLDSRHVAKTLTELQQLERRAHVSLSRDPIQSALATVLCARIAANIAEDLGINRARSTR